MSDIITTLHPENDENTNLYPNIKKENIPVNSISYNKLDNDVKSLLDSINELHPSGTDSTTNILAFTENKGIYVATSGDLNGHWFYWNGTQYVDGGTYVSSVADDKLSKTSTNSIQNKVVTENIFAIGSQINEIAVEKGINLLNLSIATPNTYFDIYGVYQTASGYFVTKPIFLKAGIYTGIRANHQYGSNTKYLIVDYAGNILSIKDITIVSGSTTKYTFTLAEDSFVILNVSSDSWLVAGDYSDSTPTLDKYHYKLIGLDTSNELDEKTEEMLNKLYITQGTNLYDKDRPSLYTDKYIYNDGSIISANGYEVSYPIFLKAGTYTISSSSDYWTNTSFLKTDINGEIISVMSGTKQSVSSPLVFTIEDGYYCFNVFSRLKSNWMLVNGSYPETLPSYENYKIEINGILESEIDYKSCLTGKTWYSCGDSATAGDFSSVETPRFDSGMYAGQLKVYPYYIGNRTGMIVHNPAVAGGTIATINGQQNRYQFSKDGNYNSIPTTADYITIWFGANDMWQSVPIGTIDSNDETTFYGAWNKVLSYYVNNYPNTKLGIVVSFWMTQNYAEAVIAIAKKYGIPTLNLYNDTNLPVTVGSQRPDVDAAVKSTRNSQWVVSATNNHPSAKYHEIESYFIEEWLKTL